MYIAIVNLANSDDDLCNKTQLLRSEIKFASLYSSIMLKKNQAENLKQPA